jgi:hypothetical protein
MSGMTNWQLDAARRYHEATKHSQESVRRGTHLLDWGNRPHLLDPRENRSGDQPERNRSERRAASDDRKGDGQDNDPQT